MKPLKNSKIGAVAGLLVFCVFAASVFALLTSGVGAYRSIAQRPGQGFGERASLAYVWTKIKNGDEAGRVSMGELGGLPALCLDEDAGGRTYRTMLYYYEGSLCELFAEAGSDFQPANGNPVVESESLLFEELDGGLIKVSSGEHSVFISKRAAPGLKGGL